MGERYTCDDVFAKNGINPKIIRTDARKNKWTHCPFCPDGDPKGKFGYKDFVFGCFRCGAGGDPIALEIMLNPNEYHGLKNDKATRSDAASKIFAFLNGGSPSASSYRQIRNTAVIETEEHPKADDEVVSAVLYEMADMCGLNKEHKADLIRRGMFEEDIKRFKFFSLPKDVYGIANKLRSKGYDLSYVPPFCIDKKGKWKANFYGSGYACPVFHKNIFCGFQIHPDNPKNGAKYIWATSAGEDKGASFGAPSTYLPGKNVRTIIITEGILKATVTYCLLKGEVTVIGVPGVKCINGLKNILPKFEHSGYAFLAYDMEKYWYNTPDDNEKRKQEQILKDEEKLKALVDEYSIGNVSLKWDYDNNGWKENYKGIDDFLYDLDDKSLFLNFINNKAEEYLKVQDFLLGV